MGQVKIWPTDLTEALVERERTGWRAGSVKLMGEEKCKITVVSLFMILRSYPYVEVFVSEANEHIMEIYLIDTRFPRNMCRVDSLRISPRVFIGYTRTFRMLERWMDNLDEDVIKGQMPQDAMNKEMETTILTNLELTRPGSTFYIMACFNHFMAIQGPCHITGAQ